MESGQNCMLIFGIWKLKIWKVAILVLESDEAFTHLVVYTPNQPFFCVENQTCSTDAHNLASAGKKREAHLQICPPGQVRKGWVRFMVETN